MRSFLRPVDLQAHCIIVHCFCLISNEHSPREDKNSSDTENDETANDSLRVSNQYNNVILLLLS